MSAASLASNALAGNVRPAGPSSSQGNSPAFSQSSSPDKDFLNAKAMGAQLARERQGSLPLPSTARQEHLIAQRAAAGSRPFALAYAVVALEPPESPAPSLPLEDALLGEAGSCDLALSGSPPIASRGCSRPSAGTSSGPRGVLSRPRSDSTRRSPERSRSPMRRVAVALVLGASSSAAQAAAICGQDALLWRTGDGEGAEILKSPSRGAFQGQVPRQSAEFRRQIRSCVCRRALVGWGHCCLAHL